MSQLYRIECIDQQHARLAALRLERAGWGVACIGKLVLTDCQDMHELDSTALDAIAIIGEADYDDVVNYATNRE